MKGKSSIKSTFFSQVKQIPFVDLLSISLLPIEQLTYLHVRIFSMSTYQILELIVI
jgi:hypothetical protein